MRKHWSYYFLFTFGLFPTNPAIIFFHVFMTFCFLVSQYNHVATSDFFLSLFAYWFCWHPEESCYLAEYPVAALYIRLCIDPSHQSIILIQKVLSHRCVWSAYTLLKGNSSESGLQWKGCRSDIEQGYIEVVAVVLVSTGLRLRDLESYVMPSKAEDILSGFRV